MSKRITLGRVLSVVKDKTKEHKLKWAQMTEMTSDEEFGRSNGIITQDVAGALQISIAEAKKLLDAAARAGMIYKYGNSNYCRWWPKNYLKVLKSIKN